VEKKQVEDFDRDSKPDPPAYFPSHRTRRLPSPGNIRRFIDATLKLARTC
jgi:hypothetical protein